MIHTEIFDKVKKIIPKALWEKYSHLSFAEMAEVEELSEWRDELQEAENQWWMS